MGFRLDTHPSHTSHLCFTTSPCLCMRTEVAQASEGEKSRQKKVPQILFPKYDVISAEATCFPQMFSLGLTMRNAVTAIPLPSQSWVMCSVSRVPAARWGMLEETEEQHWGTTPVSFGQQYTAKYAAELSNKSYINHFQLTVLKTISFLLHLLSSTEYLTSVKIKRLSKMQNNRLPSINTP